MQKQEAFALLYCRTTLNMIKTISDRINGIDGLQAKKILLILLILSKNAFSFINMSGHEWNGKLLISDRIDKIKSKNLVNPVNPVEN